MKIDWEKSLKVGGAVVALVATGYGLYKYEGAASQNSSDAASAEDAADAELAEDFNPSAGNAGAVEEPVNENGEDNSNSDAALLALITALMGPNSTTTAPKTTTPTPTKPPVTTTPTPTKPPVKPVDKPNPPSKTGTLKTPAPSKPAPVKTVPAPNPPSKTGTLKTGTLKDPNAPITSGVTGPVSGGNPPTTVAPKKPIIINRRPVAHPVAPVKKPKPLSIGASLFG